MSRVDHKHDLPENDRSAAAQTVSSTPSLPPNVSIFSPKDPSTSETLLNSSIFSRLTTSSQTQHAQLFSALATRAVVSETFYLCHGGAVLVFDNEQPGVDLQDIHHEHVRVVCLALRDADISLSVSGCVFDSTEVVKAGFQLDRLSGGDVMVVDLMHEDDDEDESDSDEEGDEGAEVILMGGTVGEVAS